MRDVMPSHQVGRVHESLLLFEDPLNSLWDRHSCSEPDDAGTKSHNFLIGHALLPPHIGVLKTTEEPIKYA